MTAGTLPSSDPPADDACASAGLGDAAMLGRQMRMLDDLAQAGVALVDEVGAQVAQIRAARIHAERESGAEPAKCAAASLADLGLVFARASRAVRMTIALQSKLIGERQSRAGPARVEARIEAPKRKARIGRIVARIARDPGEAIESSDTLREAAERLDDPDVFGDVMTRPFSEIVDAICRDLGLEPDWARLSKEAWAVEEMESGAAGAPLADLALRGGPPSRPERSPPVPTRPGLTRQKRLKAITSPAPRPEGRRRPGGASDIGAPT